MTSWLVLLKYRLKDNPRVKLEASVGVEASSGVDAIQAAIKALRDKVPGANIYQTEVNPTRAAQSGEPAWSSRQ